MRIEPVGAPNGPTTFGHYRLDRMLGRGGMGEVYRAFDSKRERMVALKVLPAALQDDHEFTARFRRECRLAAGLRSPHVVPVHDYGEIAGRPFIEMLLVDGGHLGTLIEKSGAVEPARAVDLLAQLADALDEAHAAGVVHRDVKPSNALVSARRTGDFIYLADFGIAYATDPFRTRITATGVVLGTVPYMAPEAFDPSAGPSGPAVDVYALGCVLFEMLTGRTPFEGDLRQQMHQHLTAPPPRPTAHGDAIPTDLDRVVATAMAKDPGQRYPTASDLAEDARRALSSVGRAGAKAPRPRSIFDPEPGDHGVRVLTYLSHGERVRTVAYSPDGRLIASGGDDGTARLWNASTGVELHQLGHGESKVRRVVFSPDGTRLATAATDRSVRVWSVDAGKLLAQGVHDNKLGMLATLNQIPCPTVVFSRDSTRIASGGADKTARVWDAGTGAELARVSADGSAVAFSWDGTRVASASGKNVQVWNSANSRQIVRLPHDGYPRIFGFSPRGEKLLTAGGNNQLRLWDTATYQEIRTIPHDASVFGACFSPDGTLVATRTLRRARIFDAATGQQMAELETERTAPGEALFFSPDGRHVISLRDPHIYVWDAADGRKIEKLVVTYAEGISVRPDGAMFVTGGLFAAEIHFRPHPVTGT